MSKVYAYSWRVVYKHYGNGFLVKVRMSETGVVKLEFFETGDFLDSYTTDQIELMRTWLMYRVPEKDCEIILNKIKEDDTFQN